LAGRGFVTSSGEVLIFRTGILRLTLDPLRVEAHYLLSNMEILEVKEINPKTFVFLALAQNNFTLQYSLQTISTDKGTLNPVANFETGGQELHSASMILTPSMNAIVALDSVLYVYNMRTF
jgi:hypothetical protein